MRVLKPSTGLEDEQPGVLATEGRIVAADPLVGLFQEPQDRPVERHDDDEADDHREHGADHPHAELAEVLHQGHVVVGCLGPRRAGRSLPGQSHAEVGS